MINRTFKGDLEWGLMSLNSATKASIFMGSPNSYFRGYTQISLNCDLTKLNRDLTV